MTYNNDSHITNIDEVKEFFRHVIFDYNLDLFHPDDDFSVYKDEKTQERLFSPEDCTKYNRLKAECFDVCNQADVDIYDLGWEVLEKFLMQ